MFFLPGQWKWIDKVGEGSFGTVQLGEFKVNGHRYAVKKIKQDLDSDGEPRVDEQTNRKSTRLLLSFSSSSP